MVLTLFVVAEEEEEIEGEGEEEEDETDVLAVMDHRGNEQQAILAVWDHREEEEETRPLVGPLSVLNHSGGFSV